MLLSILGVRRSKILFVVTKRMSSNIGYEAAILKLNSLQSNKSTIEQIRREIKTGQKCKNIEVMEDYLKRAGVTMTMLDRLSVIHVAGTKGKGSTSAMCESILRQHGYRTGFYSSPHLVAVRERIRLAGKPLSELHFAQHFHTVYNALYKTQKYEGDMPKYFSFLTVVAFYVFLKENVDVAIIEVGIGGMVDYTNVLRKVPIVGITALGLDHTTILGTTLPEIALAKAGIMKPGCVAYTVPQPMEAMDVLESVASRVCCPLIVAPEYSSYTYQNGLQFSIQLEAYRMNISLAIQLAHAWMRITQNSNMNTKTGFNDSSKYQNDSSSYVEMNKDNKALNDRNRHIVNILSKETVLGVRQCKWPGRYQIIDTDFGHVYLDGAHTKESMEICGRWFEQNSRFQDKVLIFSATGDRDAGVLLKPLRRICFSSVFFVIPRALKEQNDKNDNFSIADQNEALSKCKSHQKIWSQNIDDKEELFVFECVSDALSIIRNKSRVSVLVTGSLHLVGAALSLLDPKLND